MIAIVVLSAMLLLGIAYVVYGRFIASRLGLDDSRPTPAVTVNDGVDYVPASAPLLIGQHFSAISAAGPIVGPVIAALWFGWLPALLWIVPGAILVGGVHDFASLAASVRHKAASMGELVREYLSPHSYVLFLIFVWISLIYVIIAFTDITAGTFVVAVSGEAFGPGVAVSSFLYIGLGTAMGVCLYKFKMNLWLATSIFLPLVLAVIWYGPHAPASVISFVSSLSVKQWDMVILAYCFIASLLPLWLLLQPRGYLGGWLLYLVMAASLFGAIFGGFHIAYPAINVEQFKSVLNGKPVFPLLFIMIACGACSGFHGIVCAGTTSRQLCRESDARTVGYGAMLLESLVAVLAVATVMMISRGDALLSTDPNFIYAHGIARYLELGGLPFGLGLGFALLAFSTFVYDTLDVCTRLARYILQEVLGWQGKAGAFTATLITLLLPALFLLCTREKGYLVAWPIFGTTNQLLASLTLLVISIWLIKTGRPAFYALIPMVFMIGMTMWALFLQIKTFLLAVPAFFAGSEPFRPDVLISGVVGLLLFVVAAVLISQAVEALVVHRRGAATEKSV